MSPPFPFHGLLAFAFLSVLLLAGVALRARVAALQRFLFPSCLIGGVLGLAACHTGWVPFDVSLFEAFAYHCFNISFISVGLTPDEAAPGGQAGRHRLRGPLWMALIQGLTFPLQALIGGGLVLLLGLGGIELFPTFGFLVPLGFNEGPGQALSIGKVWESVGLAHAATIGLTFAAAGYFFAFFVGVPLVNRGIRRGRATFGPSALPRDFVTGLLPPGSGEAAGRLTLHTGNAETLAFQSALVGLVYGITYWGVYLLGRLLPADAAAILWGFFFFFGLGVALLLKRIIGQAGLAHLVDPGLQRRITGWAVDYLIVATVVAIQLQIVWQYLFPITLIAVVNGLLTTLLVVWWGNRLEAFGLERTAAIYGTVTGTVSCGLLLLRIADPDFRTPVAFEVAVMNVLALPVVGGGTLLVNAPLWWGWRIVTTMLVFAAMLIAAAAVLWLMGYGRRPPPAASHPANPKGL